MDRLTTTFAIALALMPATALAVADLRRIAGCQPGADDAVVTREGLLTVHLVCDRLLVEIPPSVYRRELLLNTEFAAVSGGAGVVAPGTVVDNRVVRLVRRGNRIHLEELTYEITSEREAGIERAVEQTTLPGLLRSFDILGHGTRGEALIDLSVLFVNDPPKAFALGFMKHFGMREIDVRRSYIDAFKVFPQNVGIRYYQTWLADHDQLLDEVDAAQESVTGSRGFLFYTNIYLLPAIQMRPRFFDPRVGYFATPIRDYGMGEYGGKERGYIQRYRLEKKDAKAAMSDPVHPIVFYIDQSVPEVWRPYMKLAVEDWQRVFARAGFRNAISAREAPTEDEDPTWDPDDVRYNVIRWAPSGRRNALGAAVIDPRSGEVVSSHTIFWHDILSLLESWYFTQASPLDPRAQTLPLPRDLMGELLRYVVRHEIGHALGLRHNFKSSSAVTPKQLRDPAWTRDWGTSASIMSYARFNYVAQPGDDAALLPNFGPYDYFAIEWGYRVFDGLTPDEEHARLDELAARQVSDPLLRFGGEDEVAEVDPTVASNVLCGDAIGCADLGLRNIDRIMSFLVPAATRTGEGYERLSAMYEALVQQRHRELAFVAKQVGGVAETRYQAGRGRVPFAAVNPQLQYEAVEFLIKRAFTEPTVLLDPDVLDRITPSGGHYPLQGSNVDLLRRLVDPGVFERMTEASSRGDKRYTGLDMLFDLNGGLFSELSAKVPVVTPYRRQLQRSYVTLLLAVTGAVSDPMASRRYIDRSVDSEGARAGSDPRLRGGRSLESALADVGRQFSQTDNDLSEFRAALQAAIGDLLTKVETALPGTEDTDSIIHLRLIRAQLRNAQ
jgi:hypothetical protein